jgi:hypothetical protein
MERVMSALRPVRLCRSWLFLEGGNAPLLRNAASSGSSG